jgi:hypothetical protein
MADTLAALGFTVIGGGAQLDLDKAGLDHAVQTFGAEIQGSDVALFYYAGHGVQVNGANYLVPVGANPVRDVDADFQMLNVALVLREMEGSGTRLNLVILDACRNNPFGGRGLRSTEAGLAQMRAPDGTLIAYATQPGTVAQDGNAGHSPYTAALALTMRRPGLDIFQTFNQVGLIVKRSTGGAQQPWVSSSPIDGQFYFAGLPASPSSESNLAALPLPNLPAALPPEPTTPGPSSVQAGGLFTPEDMKRVMAIAKRDELLYMPEFKIERPDGNLPAAFRKFVGIWASEIGFAGGAARHGMVIITDVDGEGRATLHWVWGTPRSTEPRRFPAGNFLRTGKIAQGQLDFQGAQPSSTAQARFGANDSLVLQFKFGDGKTSSITLKPVWRLVEAERVAKQ